MSQERHRWAGSPALPLAEAARRCGGTVDVGLREAARRLPVRFPQGYLDLVREAEADDPIRRIAWPDPEETGSDPEAIDDPVGERRLVLHPLIVRKYRDRALVLVTARCHFYCRFCFRAGSHTDPSLGEVLDAVRALALEPEIEEVILSGGDPLVLPDAELAQILRALSGLPALRTVRIHTRAPVHDPARVTPELVGTLVDAAPVPLWVAVHATHPRELTAHVEQAFALFQRAGVPLLNQTVLLRGVNADVATLAALCRALYAMQVKPYYLHHPDRIAGTARFRVTIDEGLAIYRALREALPGPALPGYVLDLPDGSGKFPVESLERVREGLWCARRASGRESFYFDVAPRG